jgi:catechol 2,3-dioxygenase-like lactoylglutathione lyase family enzyme
MSGLQTMQHVLVLADDIDATRDFYCDALGMTVGARPPLPFAGHWLYVDDVAVIHIADRTEYAATTPGTLGDQVSPQPDGRGPIDHVAFSASGYDEILARLERCGVKAWPNTIPEIKLRQLFVRDPNGIRIEINVAGEWAQ